MIQLLRDPELAMKMGDAGRNRVMQQFGLNRMIYEMEQIYQVKPPIHLGEDMNWR